MTPPSTPTGCSWVSRAVRHTPHSFHIGGLRVGILERHRGDVGDLFATVTDYFWREDTPWLVLQLPDGRRSAAPASWTDLPADTFPPTRDLPPLLAQALPPMARLCQRLRAARSTRRRPRA
jgi:hypothetical protein